jgi:2-methylfumaryl-CoA hydratase
VFKIIFGQTVPDISMRAVATLGYGGCLFGEPVYPGDTLTSETTIVSLQPGRTPDTGIVCVRTVGRNQDGRVVVSFQRWVSVRRRSDDSDFDEAAPLSSIPPPVEAGNLHQVDNLTVRAFDTKISGSPFLWDDYCTGERIDHVDGCTVEESEAMMVARLYQNTAPPHYNAHHMAATPFGRRIVFVGHIVGLARALSFNGLANVFRIAAINRARHLQATLADTTVYAWSEVLEKIELPGCNDVGALRLRTVAAKNLPCDTFPAPPTDGPPGDILLDLDYIGLIPRRITI